MTPQHASASYDFKTIYYMNEYDQATSTGKLHVRKESLFGGVKDEIIAEGVSSFTATKDGKAIVYMTNVNAETGLGTLTAYVNGKTSCWAKTSLLPHISSQNGKTVTYVGDLNMKPILVISTQSALTGGGTAQQIDTGTICALLFQKRQKRGFI